MGWKQMLRVMDSEEWTLQMAYDLIEADEQQARRLGVKTPAEVQGTAPSHRISARDPDWFKKLAKWAD